MKRWRLYNTETNETVTYGTFNGYRYFEDGYTPEPPAAKPWAWELSPPPEPSPPEPPSFWEVRKLLILDRLTQAGLFEAAMSALGGPGSLNYERWSAATVVESNDEGVRQLLSAIGADPDAILAQE